MTNKMWNQMMMFSVLAGMLGGISMGGPGHLYIGGTKEPHIKSKLNSCQLKKRKNAKLARQSRKKNRNK